MKQLLFSALQWMVSQLTNIWLSMKRSKGSISMLPFSFILAYAVNVQNERE